MALLTSDKSLKENAYMYAFVRPTFWVGVLATLAGCGEVSQGPATSPGGSTNSSQLQQISFTGIAEPASGRFQVITGPQAAIGKITEDKDGNPATVTTGTAQIYGPSVSFASGGVGYPAACNAASPLVMIANVEVFSGFTEQLRNVFARITSKSGGQTFCTIASAGAFGGSLTPNVGLYSYKPLDGGKTPSAIKRSLQWAMNLPDNGTFWFNGELWAEIIPQSPTNISPADGTIFHTSGSSANVAVSWKDDPLADGTDPENTGVKRPTSNGALLTVLRCNKVSAGAYNPASCAPFTINGAGTGPWVLRGGTYSASLGADYWYQWRLQTAFVLPGNGTTQTLGTAITTRQFSVVKP
jgi:hypothetical protein